MIYKPVLFPLLLCRYTDQLNVLNDYQQLSFYRSLCGTCYEAKKWISSSCTGSQLWNCMSLLQLFTQSTYSSSLCCLFETITPQSAELFSPLKRKVSGWQFYKIRHPILRCLLYFCAIRTIRYVSTTACKKHSFGIFIRLLIVLLPFSLFRFCTLSSYF